MQNSFFMMKRIILFSFLAVLLNVAKSQVVINEICYTNIGPAVAILDGYANASDYIELYNATSGLPEPMTNYYLTNDITKPHKWKIPSTITIPSLGFQIFFCTGRNTIDPAGFYHTNFDIEQCKNQWVMLVRYPGVIVDSFFVRRTKPGDNWGRYPDFVSVTNQGWKLLNGASTAITSFSASNGLYPAASAYIAYAPSPTFSTQAGFTPPASGQYDMFIADTVNFQINYTQGDCNLPGGTVPCTSFTGCVGNATVATTYTYVTGIDIIPATGITNVITAITIPKGTYSLSYLPSFAETNTYFDGVDLAGTPGFGVLSTVIDKDFFTAGPSATVHVEYFDKNKFYSEAAGGAVQPPNDGWLNQQRGFDVSFDDRTGYGCSLKGNVYNDATFGVSTRTVFTSFEVSAATKDNFSMITPTVATNPPPKGTHMRDAFAQTYAMKYKLNLDGMHYKPIRTFVNGCYWGIYEFREIPDAEYLEHYFGIPKDSNDILRQHVVGSIFNGSDTGWVTTPMTGPTANNDGIFNYIKTTPVFNPGTYYDNSMARLSQISFMDHFIYNSYLVNTDLTSLNTTWWRKRNNGLTAPIASADTLMKWRYFMWDMNNILGLRVAPTTFTTSGTAPMMTSPCIFTSTVFPTNPNTYTTVTSSYSGHTLLLNRLLLNAKFKNDYLNRYQDLLNTVLSCNKMLSHYNYFRNLFTPEMANHCVFWGVNQPDWDFNMDTLRERITQRCTKADSLLSKCLNLAGPYRLNIDVKPSGAGTVDLNSLHLTSFVWSGDYYQTKVPQYLNTYLEAYPIDTSIYVFDHWEFTASTNSTTATPGTLNSNNYLFKDSISFVLTEDDYVTAVFADKRTDVIFPTGFTPNGDGQNETFSPLGAAARFSQNYELRIWNRWGQEVFRSTDWSLGWDGNYNGQLAQTGVYAYLLTYKNVLGEDKIVKGNVTLIR